MVVEMITLTRSVQYPTKVLPQAPWFLPGVRARWHLHIQEICSKVKGRDCSRPFYFELALLCISLLYISLTPSTNAFSLRLRLG
ncbi:hypothetical protein BH10ACI4_BH10ACI4_36020 [soil metagenome]